ncbi:MAG: hypothetical protein JRD89_14620 [Deltaproteobacteria bacterium]|nr:hypothetical protein [Deltaproteobacteria bacterium]
MRSEEEIRDALDMCLVTDECPFTDLPGGISCTECVAPIILNWVLGDDE